MDSDFYKHIVEEMPTGFAYHKIVCNENGNPIDYIFLDLNSAFEKLTGLKKEDIINRNVTDVLPGIEESEFDWIKFYGEVALNGSKKVIEQFSDVLQKWYKVNVYSPEKGYFVTHFIELTKEMSQIYERAEDILLQEKIFTEALLESIPGYLYVYDSTGKLIRWNKKHETMTGYNSEELANMTLDKWFDAEDYVRVAAAVGEVFEKGYGEVEADLIRKDGEKIRILSNGVKLVKDDKIYFTGVGVDVTQQRKDQDTIQANQQFLTEIIENSGTLIYAKDRTGRYELVNKKWEQTTGMTRDFVIGKTDEQLFSATEAAEFRKIDSQVMESGQVVEKEETLINSDEIRYFISIKIPMRGKNNEIKGVCGVSTEITDRKKVEKQLLEAKNKAEDASNAKSQFLANMSHEIRTPLNGITGMMQLLAMTQLTQDQKEYIRLSKVSSDLLLMVINDILDYSKIEAGMMELESTNLNIRKILEDAVGLFSLSAAKKRIEINSQVEATVPENLIGDTFRLRQVFSNIIGNAVKYTDKGHVDIIIEKIDVLENNKIKLQCKVKDTGIGIPDNKKELLFKSFSQIDNSNTRKYGGTGLGLSICKGLINKMNGDLWVESKLGEGSTFYFTFILETDEFNFKQNDLEGSDQDKETSTDTPYILVVEDDELSRIVISRFIKNKGWKVAMAENGKDAIELFQNEEFDAIVTDVQMPLISGFQLTGIIRTMETNKHTPIIAMTAYALKGDKEKCIEAGMDDYISKPIGADEFYSTIQKWLNRNKLGGIT